MTAAEGAPWVTGVGVVTPIGSDPESFWDALVHGRSGSRPVRSFNTDGLPNKRGCEVPPHDVPDQLREAVLGGRCTELALMAVQQAVENAGLTGELGGSRRVCVVIGTTMGEVTQFEQDRARHPDEPPSPADVHSLAQRPFGIIGRSVAKYLGLRGSVVTVPAACAAGSYAVGFAASLIARKRADTVIAVGCEAFSRLAFMGFMRMRAMSRDECRPFSLNRPGLLLGEGAAALVLESPESARRRGAESMGSVSGFGLSCDAHHVTGPHPQAAGAIRAIRQALERAKLGSDAIDYINAHGTGTPLNDKVESLAIHSVFGDSATTVPVSSIKGVTGHMMGAAGATEAVASLLAIRHGVIPPTSNWLEHDPDCAIDCVPNAAREKPLQHVLSCSYAFGGNNASLVLSAPTG